MATPADVARLFDLFDTVGLKPPTTMDGAEADRVAAMAVGWAVLFSDVPGDVLLAAGVRAARTARSGFYPAPGIVHDHLPVDGDADLAWGEVLGLVEDLFTDAVSAIEDPRTLRAIEAVGGIEAIANMGDRDVVATRAAFRGAWRAVDRTRSNDAGLTAITSAPGRLLLGGSAANMITMDDES